MKPLLVALELLDQDKQAFLAEPIGRAGTHVAVMTDHRIQLLTFPAHRQPSQRDNPVAADRVPLSTAFAALQSVHFVRESSHSRTRRCALRNQRRTRKLSFTRGKLGKETT